MCAREEEAEIWMFDYISKDPDSYPLPFTHASSQNKNQTSHLIPNSTFPNHCPPLKKNAHSHPSNYDP
jgi:hypothetical protein